MTLVVSHTYIHVYMYWEVDYLNPSKKELNLRLWWKIQMYYSRTFPGKRLLLWK